MINCALMELNQLTTMASAARALKLSKQRVSQLIQEGILVAIDFEGRKLVTLESVNKAKKRNKKPGPKGKNIIATK